MPLGVCAGIVPWNFPILLMLWKVTQAVITGNCCHHQAFAIHASV